MKEFLFFRNMLTPKFIIVLYWLALVTLIISGLAGIFSNFSLGSIGKAVLVVLIGALMTRVYCELMIVLFKIHENLSTLVEMKKSGDNRNDVSGL